jgi:hypothetical protein
VEGHAGEVEVQEVQERKEVMADKEKAKGKSSETKLLQLRDRIERKRQDAYAAKMAEIKKKASELMADERAMRTRVQETWKDNKKDKK